MAIVRFRPQYLVLAVAVFAVLVLIETQLDSGFVRFSVGDALVVVLLYGIIMAVSTWSRFASAMVSLLIAYAVETSQALDLVERLGITPNRFTDVVLGNTFTWSDMAAYTVGIVFTLVAEAILGSRTSA